MKNNEDLVLGAIGIALAIIVMYLSIKYQQGS